MAVKLHLVLDQGSDFANTIVLKDKYGDPMDLTGFTANAVMRKWYTQVNSVPFTCSVNVAAGSVTLSMAANVSANIAPLRYVYDVELTASNGAVQRIREGIVTVTPQCTK